MSGSKATHSSEIRPTNWSANLTGLLQPAIIRRAAYRFPIIAALGRIRWQRLVFVAVPARERLNAHSIKACRVQGASVESNRTGHKRAVKEVNV